MRAGEVRGTARAKKHENAAFGRLAHWPLFTKVKFTAKTALIGKQKSFDGGTDEERKESGKWSQFAKDGKTMAPVVKVRLDEARMGRTERGNGASCLCPGRYRHLLSLALPAMEAILSKCVQSILANICCEKAFVTNLKIRVWSLGGFILWKCVSFVKTI